MPRSIKKQRKQSKQQQENIINAHRKAQEQLSTQMTPLGEITNCATFCVAVRLVSIWEVTQGVPLSSKKRAPYTPLFQIVNTISQT